jgi:hypothetical protein
MTRNRTNHLSSNQRAHSDKAGNDMNSSYRENMIQAERHDGKQNESLNWQNTDHTVTKPLTI